ncbi:hypothetical protein K466DRAFT_528028 [Polyporus arcularius HHB13444]|uniref:protein-tyrosine-phosphatase n=1 Tax=Polyporus arcularius HHB13444 TaxID=1314778 RepID=A0A5C3P449_9APHY|nr:hypothetical protein K466DRAFT_528028 [Polyporus arcularius HHB13444]
MSSASTKRLSMSLSLSSPPTAPSSTVPPAVALAPTAFTALSSISLQDVVSDPSALILDIRPHNSYVQARIPNALSLSVPSTLLKRPNFPLAKLAEMLPTSVARDKFSKWPEASRIVVYDADTATLPQNLQANPLLGLMRKFRSEGYPAGREVAWLRGGFHAVWRDYPGLVDHSTPADETDEDDGQAEPETDGDPAPLGKSVGVLRAKHLPKSAFTSASTISLRPNTCQLPAPVPMQVVPSTPALSLEDPFSKVPLPLRASAIAPSPLLNPSKSEPGKGDFTLRLPSGLVRPKSMAGTTQSSVPTGPLYSLPTSSTHLAHGTNGAYTRSAGFPVSGRQVAFNPFFDNIRQNIELRDTKGSDGEGIPLKLPRRVRRRIGELPFEWLRRIARKSRLASESSSSTDLSSDSDDPSDDDKPSSGSPSTCKPASSVSVHTPVTLNPRPLQPQIPSDAHRSPPRSPSSSPVPMRSSHTSHASPPSPTSSTLSQSPPDADELTRALEKQFYKIELGEQKRLLGVMERHSLESGKVIKEASGARGIVGIVPAGEAPEGRPCVSATVSGEDTHLASSDGEEQVPPFPYSITAGLEKGSKNRYRNIWPFEHARVRLRKAKPDDDDYMNASYVQPLGTTKRYIATQGPLPATFVDFWTLCWEQNVHVIVMLTREIEGSSVKCGKYWAEGTYGTLHLKLLETNDTPELERQRAASETGFFNMPMPKSKPKRDPKSKKRQDGDVDMKDDRDSSTIKRVFELTNSAYPLAPPRIVTQFQYLEWPDLNVPNNPRGVLRLMRQVEEAVEQSRSSGEKPWGEGPLHRPSGSSGASTSHPHSSTLSSGHDRPMDEIDPLTGVSLVAEENPPVLLHCSAGVGRTGGFIAVDAVLDGVRREMRKRKEGLVRETADAKIASEFEGRSGDASSGSAIGRRSRSASTVSRTSEAMDIDTTFSEPGQDCNATALTIPVSVGDCAVHVPVAGFAESEPMDVDQRQDASAPISSLAVKGMGLSAPLLQASPELVAEVRRATMSNWSSMAQRATSTAQGDDAQSSSRVADPSDCSSESWAARSSWRFGSASGSRTHGTRSRSSVSPPTSHADSSTSAMVGKTARLSMRSPSPPTHDVALPPRNDSQLRTVSVPVGASSDPMSRPEPEPHSAQSSQPSVALQSHRMDTWRSEVQSSSSSSEYAAKMKTKRSARPFLPQAAEKRSAADSPPSETPSPTLREPRRLHDDTSPPLLSTYNEPIRRVIEDMREQRMSLCQSLRQYVFVHRAIIEGALMIVDEEKKRGLVAEEGARRRTTSSKTSSKSSPVPASMLDGAKRLSASSSEDEAKIGRKRSVPEFVAGNTIIEGVVSPSPGRPKRGASPTELKMEGVDGGVLLTKRPSVKRSQRANEP